MCDSKVCPGREINVISAFVALRVPVQTEKEELSLYACFFRDTLIGDIHVELNKRARGILVTLTDTTISSRCCTLDRDNVALKIHWKNNIFALIDRRQLESK